MITSFPVCQGGSNDYENLVTACKSCNRSKAGKTPEQWAEMEIATMSWIRLHDTSLHSTKVRKLSDYDYRVWTELLLVSREHEGVIPPLEDLKFLVNRRPDHLSRALSSGLLRRG